jgi:hypothetical protein
MPKPARGRTLYALCLLATCSACSDGERLARPVADPDAAARAFKLYYKERVERTVVAYQRFMLVGDTTFGVVLDKVGVARTGDEFEVVPGPNDNNDIGISVWTTWHAYRLFRTRTLELALLRLLNGLTFFEAVSGHPGMTARFVYPGWTRVVDGLAGTVVRTRQGAPAAAPEPPDPALEAEMIATFYAGVRVTHREDPEDILFAYMPAHEIGQYALTYSFSALPVHLRSSDCCASIMRTPAPYPWEGAYWGNHNSRDNFPDLSMGYVTALAVTRDRDASPELRAAARRALEAGQRIGDSIAANDAILTATEHHPYDYLEPSGTVRPDGETEDEDLGTLADCQMAFLSRAISSSGLSTPLPAVRAPGSIEYLLVDALGQDVSCEIVPERTCTRLEEAFCGYDWDEMEELEMFGNPWLELVRELEASSPGSAETMIGGFQDDFYEITLAVNALVQYADLAGERELGARARGVLGDLTHLMRVFADIIYTQTRPDRLAERLAQAALFDGWAGLDSTPREDLADFASLEGQTAAIEGWPAMADTQPAPLLTDEELRAEVTREFEGEGDAVKQRYTDAYGDTPPIRRSADGYEARGVPEAEHPWQPVDRSHHVVLGGARLLRALPLCATAPELLDCTWAVLGCARPDLDASGTVDATDTALWEAARDAHAQEACRAGNGWCGGADLDRTGEVDEIDQAFLEAAQGCRV